MPNINYLNSKLKFWSNENNEPFHIHIQALSGNANAKVWIKKDGSFIIEHENEISKDVLKNGLEGISLNLTRLKSMYCNHFGISVNEIVYKD